MMSAQPDVGLEKGGGRASDATAPRARAVLPITGLACGGGGRLTVEKILRSAAGVDTAVVNPVTEEAYVTFDPDRCSEEVLRRALDAAGFLLAEAPDGP